MDRDEVEVEETNRQRIARGSSAHIRTSVLAGLHTDSLLLDFQPRQLDCCYILATKLASSVLIPLIGLSTMRILLITHLQQLVTKRKRDRVMA